MKQVRFLALISALLLVAAAIPIAQSWAGGSDTATRSHTWQIEKGDGPTSLTLRVGQQIEIHHRVRMSVVVQTDEGWTVEEGAEVDACVTLSDSIIGDIGQVCAGATPITFAYRVPVGPYETCGRHAQENIATFVTDDTGTTGTVSWVTDVLVPCGGE